ncbi:hypothetical protein D3C84_638100 [compost metagenome]
MVAVGQSGERFEPVAERVTLAGNGKLFQPGQFQRRQAQPIEITWRARLTQVDLRKIIE